MSKRNRQKDRPTKATVKATEPDIPVPARRQCRACGSAERFHIATVNEQVIDGRFYSWDRYGCRRCGAVRVDRSVSELAPMTKGGGR